MEDTVSRIEEYPSTSTTPSLPPSAHYGPPLRLTRALVKAILGDEETPGCSSTWRFRSDSDLDAPVDIYVAGSMISSSWLNEQSQDEAQSTEVVAARLTQPINDELAEVRSSQRPWSGSFIVEGLPIYFELGDRKQLPEESGFSVILVPVGIDTSILWQIREGTWPPHRSRVNILENLQLPDHASDASIADLMMDELRDGATALRKILELRERFTRREIVMSLNAHGKHVSTPPTSYPADENGSLKAAIAYFDMVQDIQRYNYTGAIGQIAFSHHDSEQTRVDIEHNMRLRWNKALRTEHKTERRGLRQRKKDAYYLGDEQEKSRVDREKRLLNKRTFDECKSRELSEAAAGLRDQIEQPLSELPDLYSFYLAQRSDMTTGSMTLPETVEVLDQNLTSLADIINSEWTDLEEQITALDSLLSHANTVTRKVVTQLHRLTAVDVQDPDARAEEVSKRLEHPEALEFIGRVMENMQTVHDVALSAGERSERLEDSTHGVATGALDVMVAAEDCVIYAEVERSFGKADTGNATEAC